MNERNRNSNQTIEKKIVIAERDNIAAVLENKKVTDSCQVLMLHLLMLVQIKWAFYTLRMLWEKVL